jgi:general secretion pathway protein D
VIRRHFVLLLLPLLATTCAHPRPPVWQPLPPVSGNTVAAPRLNGDVGSPEAIPPAQLTYGTAPTGNAAPGVLAGAGGDVSLDFADTDIREVVAQILGNALHENYTIDPAVKGTATFHTATPIPRARLLATLQVLLSQNGATLVQSGGLYRVAPAADAATAGIAGSDISAGSVVVPLRYASAEALAKLLTPFAGTTAKIAAEQGRNALLVSGEPNARASMVALAQSFDVDVLAGQSYALLPVPTGDPKDFASAMQDAFRTQNGGALSGLVRVVPLERLASVLVVANQPRYIDAARRVFALVEKARHFTERAWHVYYLQNSHADDVAYLLQQAFTPHNVTAQPSAATQPKTGAQGSGAGGGLGQGGSAMGGGGGLGGGSTGGGLGASGGLGGSSIGGGTASLAQGGLGATPGASGTAGGGLGGGGNTAAAPSAASATSNPLLGGLDTGNGADSDTNTMRIIPNPQNNAVLIYATPQEETTVEAMLRKVDILPLQVRIDAVIAEVTLTDQLQFGTQFFFKGGSGFNTLLSGATTGGITAALFSGKGISEALAALQSVTTVDVLSSPELLVLDNQTAQLQVGALVPYLSQTSQSTITSGSPVINSIQYQQTGVIMEVTPRVNSGGLVTLDIAQEVSDVNSAVTTSGINSPTFDERRVESRVVVQDGQTVGLAGLIQDSRTKENQGIPWLKDIPLLGVLAGQQNNNRSRTELLVLITPHVMHDQRDARALTEDLREQLPNAAAVPDTLQSLPLSGSPDPSQALRQRLNLGP